MLYAPPRPPVRRRTDSRRDLLRSHTHRSARDPGRRPPSIAARTGTCAVLPDYVRETFDPGTMMAARMPGRPRLPVSGVALGSRSVRPHVPRRLCVPVARRLRRRSGPFTTATSRASSPSTSGWRGSLTPAFPPAPRRTRSGASSFLGSERAQTRNHSPWRTATAGGIGSPEADSHPEEGRMGGTAGLPMAGAAARYATPASRRCRARRAERATAPRRRMAGSSSRGEPGRRPPLERALARRHQPHAIVPAEGGAHVGLGGQPRHGAPVHRHHDLGVEVGPDGVGGGSRILARAASAGGDQDDLRATGSAQSAPCRRTPTCRPCGTAATSRRRTGARTRAPALAYSSASRAPRGPRRHPAAAFLRC